MSSKEDVFAPVCVGGIQERELQATGLGMLLPSTRSPLSAPVIGQQPEQRPKTLQGEDVTVFSLGKGSQSMMPKYLENKF